MSSAQKSIEIEIQVQVEKPAQLVAFLQKEGKYIGKSHQIDKYYSPPHRNFTEARPVKEWLRLRNSSGKFSINYKNWYFGKDGRSHYCDEYETPVGEIAQLEKIFSALDMKPIVVVDKTRRVWHYRDYEVALDKVKGLGNFVEIEYKGKSTKKKPSEITREMVNFLKEFSVGKIVRNYVGYPFQLLFPNEVRCENL